MTIYNIFNINKNLNVKIAIRNSGTKNKPGRNRFKN